MRTIYFEDDIVEILNYKQNYNQPVVGTRHYVTGMDNRSGKLRLQEIYEFGASGQLRPEPSQVMLYKRPFKNWIKLFWLNLKSKK